MKAFRDVAPSSAKSVVLQNFFCRAADEFLLGSRPFFAVQQTNFCWAADETLLGNRFFFATVSLELRISNSEKRGEERKGKGRGKERKRKKRKLNKRKVKENNHQSLNPFLLSERGKKKGTCAYKAGKRLKETFLLFFQKNIVTLSRLNASIRKRSERNSCPDSSIIQTKQWKRK